MPDAHDLGPAVADLLSPPVNFAVVQLPGRRFPGVVFQGDSLAELCEQASRLALLARGTPVETDASDISEQLDSILRGYLGVLRDRSLDPPHPYRPPSPSSESGDAGPDR